MPSIHSDVVNWPKGWYSALAYCSLFLVVRLCKGLPSKRDLLYAEYDLRGGGGERES